MIHFMEAFLWFMFGIAFGVILLAAITFYSIRKETGLLYFRMKFQKRPIPLNKRGVVSSTRWTSFQFPSAKMIGKEVVNYEFNQDRFDGNLEMVPFYVKQGDFETLISESDRSPEGSFPSLSKIRSGSNILLKSAGKAFGFTIHIRVFEDE